MIALIAATAESNRSPFDLPEGESEIIAGYFIEYSGFKFALFFLAEYLGMFATSALGITLFLGGWSAPLSFLSFIPSYMWGGGRGSEGEAQRRAELWSGAMEKAMFEPLSSVR